MKRIRTFALLAASGLLSGCVYSQPTLSNDFGAAFKESTVAQIADPDAVYKRDVPPGYDGERAASSIDRYRAGKVIQPVPVNASTIGVSGSGAGMSSGAPH